jgi:acylphosphatase
MACLRLVISGRVQGVWYRESMRQEAERLEITGWVQNLRDGRVEAIVCGEPDKLEAILAWAHKGPPLARVSNIETSLAEGEHSSFEKR